MEKPTMIMGIFSNITYIFSGNTILTTIILSSIFGAFFTIPFVLNPIIFADNILNSFEILSCTTIGIVLHCLMVFGIVFLFYSLISRSKAFHKLKKSFNLVIYKKFNATINTLFSSLTMTFAIFSISLIPLFGTLFACILGKVFNYNALKKFIIVVISNIFSAGAFLLILSNQILKTIIIATIIILICITIYRITKDLQTSKKHQ